MWSAQPDIGILAWNRKKSADPKPKKVTIDAMGCQKEIAHEIIESDTDYLLATYTTTITGQGGFR